MTCRSNLNRQKKAEIYAVSAVLLWSTVATAFKIALRYLTFLELLFYALPASILSTAVIITFQRKWNEVLDYEMFRKTLFSGFLNPFLYYILLFKSYELLKAQQALTLNYTWAIFYVLLSALVLKQKLRPKEIISVVISFSGAAIIITGGSIRSFANADPAGVMIVLSSAVVWAVYWLYGKKTEGAESVKLFQSFVAGFCYVCILMAFSGKLRMPPAAGIVSAFYVGLFEMGITFFLWSRAVHLAERASTIGTLAFISPFISFIFIATFLGESIRFSSAAGMALIAAGIIFGRRN